MGERGEKERREKREREEKKEETTNILPVSAFLHPYTSPNPPLPMIRCTLKSFIVN